ncbi:hypothetical protein EYF80_064388 [Liparis tanakae]|uniref:Uncharacterized protein n=1 Tax=Liparis tanakae TaxID=230148 RepID=A0A4Z2E9P6_9TELE|nr:hypothetical protein EYF80_064388 [Liparis tanakae]
MHAPHFGSDRSPSLLFFSFVALQILFHVAPLCNYSSPSSIALAFLFLHFRELLLSAGHVVLPSVQDDMSGCRDTSCDTCSPYRRIIGYTMLIVRSVP